MDKQQGKTGDENIFRDTRLGRALSDALGLGEQDLENRRQDRRQKQKAAQRRNAIASREQTKRRARSDQDRADYNREQSRSKNMAGKRKAERDRANAMRGADAWTPIFEQMEAMGTMPKDKTAIEKVLSTDNSSETITTSPLSREEQIKMFMSGKSIDELLEAFNAGHIDFPTYIAAQEKELSENPDGEFAQKYNQRRKNLLGPWDDDETEEPITTDEYNELVRSGEIEVPPVTIVGEGSEAMEPEEEITALDMNEYDRPVDEKEFAEFMENRPEFMMPVGNPLADFDVYTDDEGKTRVRDSELKRLSEKPIPQMKAGPPTLSSFFANLFDPVSKAIEDLYTKSRLSGSQSEKYEIMDQIEDLQKLQDAERAERYSGPGATRRLKERRDRVSDRNVPQRILQQMRASQIKGK